MERETTAEAQIFFNDNNKYAVCQICQWQFDFDL